MKTALLLLLFGLSYYAMANDISSYIIQCSPNVAYNTMYALIKTESRFNTWAININNKGKKLNRQPKNLTQAINWVNYLEKNNYNFDVGLAQINIKNIHYYGYHAEDMLDPCLNLKIAQEILKKHYAIAIKSSASATQALYKTISAYNTGNFNAGFKNGYVQMVLNNATSINPKINK